MIDEYYKYFISLFKKSPPGENKKLISQVNKARIGSIKEMKKRYGKE